MNVKRGDVVLVDFPFSSGARKKVRPALIVQNDRDNLRLSNTIIAQITSRVDRARKEPTQLLVETNSPDGQNSGLRADSTVNCANLFTIDKQVILRKLGQISAHTMRQIDECLKAALELS